MVVFYEKVYKGGSLFEVEEWECGVVVDGGEQFVECKALVGAEEP